MKRLSQRSISVMLCLAAAAALLCLPAAADLPSELSAGDTGEPVAALQAELAEYSLYSGEISGVFDEATEAAVMRLQLLLGLCPDGVFDAEARLAFDASVETGEFIPVMPGLLLLSGLVIGLDPGHQVEEDLELEPNSPFKDVQKVRMTAGGVGVRTGVEEYYVNLSVAAELRRCLELLGATVVMSRTENGVSVSNLERAQIMNEADVDFWLRIHCNSCDDESVCGARVLTPCGLVGSDVAAESRRLGFCVISAFCERTDMPMLITHSLTDQTGFNWSCSPVIAIEMGYLSNAVSDLRLSRTSYQNECALGILYGIADYANGVDIPTAGGE